MSMKMTIDETKEHYRKDAKITVINSHQTGGQTVGTFSNKVQLYSEELEITIETSFHRSQLKNIELLHAMFEVAINELIK